LSALDDAWAAQVFQRIDSTDGTQQSSPWFYLPVPQPAANTPAQNWYAAGDWERVLREAPGALSAAGLPLGPLAALHALAAVSDERSRPERWQDFVQLAIRDHPSVVTPAVLKQGAALLGDGSAALDLALREWQEDETLRSLLRSRFGEPLSPEPGWLSDESRRVALICRDPTEDHQGWCLLKVRAVESFAANLVRSWLDGVPDFVGVSIHVGGHEIFRSQGATDSLRLLNLAEKGGLQLRWWLAADSRAFHAELWRRFGWMGTFLALAWLICAVAGWQTWRVFRQQERLAEQQSNFLSSVSHELRTPLASLRLMTESLLNGTVKKSDRVREYLEVIHDESVRLAGLTDNVLDTTRLQRGVKRYQFEEVDPGEVVSAVVNLLELRAQRLRVTLRVECEALNPLPKADADALRQAILNLLDNALKHSPAESVVAVCVSPWGNDGWSLEVRDQGPGLPESERDKVWQPFYRVGNELRRETLGVGLGLSLVAQIVKAHSGRAELINAVDGGLRVRLYFANNPVCVS
jgi:signal transduction histidine kinase